MICDVSASQSSQINPTFIPKVQYPKLPPKTKPTFFHTQTGPPPIRPRPRPNLDLPLPTLRPRLQKHFHPPRPRFRRPSHLLHHDYSEICDRAEGDPNQNPLPRKRPLGLPDAARRRNHQMDQRPGRLESDRDQSPALLHHPPNLGPRVWMSCVRLRTRQGVVAAGGCLGDSKIPLFRAEGDCTRNHGHYNRRALPRLPSPAYRCVLRTLFLCSRTRKERPGPPLHSRHPRHRPLSPLPQVQARGHH